MKHTRGPWGTIGTGPAFRVQIVSAEGEPLAMTYGQAAQTEDARLMASGPDMLGLLLDIASIIDTTDSEHPAFMDSGADSIALLWELNGRLRATIRQANGGAA